MKKVKILIITIAIIAVLFAICIGVIYVMTPKIRAVIVKVDDKGLGIMGIQGELYNIGFGDEGNIGFKKGQEILIYYDGIILQSYPAQLGNVEKIKIVKEKSNIEIPKNVLKHYYNSRDNVKVSVSELTPKGISFTITDTNDIPYEYTNEYSIHKKNEVWQIWLQAPKKSGIKSETTGIYEKINENTIKKTYNWSSIYGELGERRL